MKPAHLIKKLLGIFTFLFVTILGVLLSIALWIYFYPKDAWQFAQKHLLPDDLKVEWSEARFSIDHIEGLNWDLDIFLKDLVVEKVSPQITAHIDRIQLSANVALAPKTRMHLRNLELKSDSPVIIKTEPTGEPLDLQNALKKITSGMKKLKSLQERIAIDRIDIQLRDLQYSSGTKAPVLASVQVSKSGVNSSQIGFDITVRDLSAILTSLNIDGKIELVHFGTSAPFLNADIRLNGTKLKADIPLTLVYENDQLKGQSKFEASYRMKSGRLATKSVLEINFAKKALTARIQGNITGIPGPLSKLTNIRITYNLPLDRGDWLSLEGHAIISAPIPLFFINSKTRKLVEQRCQCRLPQSVEAKVAADIWLERILGSEKTAKPVLKAELRLESISNAILTADLRAGLDLFKSEKTWIFKPTLNSRIHILRFQDVREILRANRALIPAPFSVLEGSLDFTAKSPVDIDSITGNFSAQARLSTDLKSPRQQVIVDSVVNLGAASNFKTIDVDFDALIHELQLELPPLDPIKGLPRLVRDSRILLKPVTVKKKPAVKLFLSFKVRTAKKAAIRLLHPLARPYIPISVNYERNGKAEQGSIAIEAFRIKYLKREVFVDSLALNLDETASMDFPIDGRFHVNQTNYLVKMRVTGTVKEPNIELSSDPYLNRADIVSVLLFDRTRENLVGGDAETSGNAQAAMADRAVGLFGLWAFASTPIRSVSYNSVTKEYSATIVLGEGLTAGIGTSLDDYTSLEIRKRLSKRWVITTSWSPSEADESFGEVVLQWEKRY